MSDAVDAFDRAAHGYDEWYLTKKGGQVFVAERRLVDSLLPLDGVGLEIGAGTGVFSDALTNERRIIVCLDLSKKMLRRAKQRDLPCVLGSADSMPFRRKSLGFAYLVTVLEFLKTPINALEEVSRALGEAPVVVLFINSESPWGELYKTMKKTGDPIFKHARLFSLKEVEEIFRKVGLSPAKALGTLTAGPTSPNAGDEIAEPSEKTGVIAVKLVKQSA
jgi:ubiquinone/menaquinone biosynthesis C-methylase UbiE